MFLFVCLVLGELPLTQINTVPNIYILVMFKCCNTDGTNVITNCVDSVPSFHSQLLALQDSSTTKSPSPLNPTDPSQGTTHQYTNPFTSPPLLSPANPFFSQLQRNPFFQELCTVTPLTPALPSLFSPDCSQHEASPFSTSNPTPSDLDEAGNTNRHTLNRESEMASNPKTINIAIGGDVNPAVSQSKKNSDWDNFISENLENEVQMNNLPPPLIELPDLTPLGAEGGLIVSNVCGDLLSNTNPACTLTDHLNSSNTLLHPSANYICWKTCNTDLNNSAAQEALVSDFDSSLPQNSSIEFSELNTLACPYPSVSTCSVNQNCFNAASDTESLEKGPQITSLCSISSSASSLSFVSTETLGNKSLDPLKLPVDKKADHAIVKYPFEMLMDAPDKSVETLKTSVPCCKDFSSDDTLEPTIITSDSPDYQALNISQTRTDNVELSESITSEFKESFVKDEAHLNGSRLAHTAKDMSGMSVPAGTSDCVIKARVVMEEKDAEGEPGCMSLDLIDNLEVIMTSSPGVSSNVSLIKEEISDWLPDPSRGNLRVDIFPGSQRGHPEVDISLGSRQTMSVGYLHPPSANVSMATEPSALIAALSPGSLLFHSLYTSADSEQYVTCRSLHNSLSLTEISEEAKPKHDPFQEPEPGHQPFQEAKPKEFSSQRCLPANYLSQKNSFMSIYDASKNSLLKCDLIEEAVATGDEAILNYDPSVDVMLNKNLIQDQKVAPPKMMTWSEELVKLDPEPCLVYNETNATEPRSSHNVHLDGAVVAECVQPAEKIYDSDFMSKPSSSITQDLVTTDLLLDNVFVPQNTATHAVSTIAVENSNKNSNAQEATSVVPSTASSSVDNCTAELPLPDLSSIEQPNLPSGHDLNLNFLLSSLDLLPLASSTPDVALGTNTMPSFPFPMMPVLASAPLSPTQLASHPPFSQETQQVPTLNSPHPVKPLTPPDEKRSEGRSVLEKLKSTIHPGRSHHGDQEPEKRALVEGGGSYYHLNHSELVSLLLQRDAELQQEKEEYERRGVLLEKREIEIKKMKVLIRDLEDYIDTLLVRIMEQTPTLLQVRSKMK
ncbi:uncharacterized protein rab11fip5a isoform X1 [Salminus brasiliensis]|uniref:uncharacterized protein rab11fip5a isoform X1 n=1 Tax=Salminus brasiliensis TaxID=930266 RepID=UPI003B82CA20